MKVLFVGESWMGSCARSIKEALQRVSNGSDDRIAEINEDLYLPKAQTRWLRAVNRILNPAHRRELALAILAECNLNPPDVLLVYKGNALEGKLIREVRSRGVFTVNIFPDYSPLVYGRRLREALAEYDLVISTKTFHPPLWRNLYGYANECVFVPHGYDPALHHCAEPPGDFDIDVGLAATWRAEYHALMQELASLLPSNLRIGVAGHGWPQRRHEFPSHWTFPGLISGVAYPAWVRRCKIMLAPVNTEVIIDGKRQPGDQDTSRTYELAAAHCFFLHRRSPFVETLYDEKREVPLFENAVQLAEQINYFIGNADKRLEMAAAAHRRAVPAYSTDARAAEISRLLRRKPMRAQCDSATAMVSADRQ